MPSVIVGAGGGGGGYGAGYVGGAGKIFICFSYLAVIIMKSASSFLLPRILAVLSTRCSKSEWNFPEMMQKN